MRTIISRLCRRRVTYSSKTLFLSNSAGQALGSGLEANCSDNAGAAVALGAAVDILLRGWTGHCNGGKQKRGSGEDLHVDFLIYCF